MIDVIITGEGIWFKILKIIGVIHIGIAKPRVEFIEAFSNQKIKAYDLITSIRFNKFILIEKSLAL
jgi:hypothetical protein